MNQNKAVSKTDSSCIETVQFYFSCFFIVLKNRLLSFGMALPTALVKTFFKSIKQKP